MGIFFLLSRSIITGNDAMKPISFIWCFLFSFITICSSEDRLEKFISIEGFSDHANLQLNAFLDSVKTLDQRKIAVFDGDGTVLGQVPHYLADECLHEFALKNPNRKPLIIDQMKNQSNVSLPYVQNRVIYLSGQTLEDVRAMGADCFDRFYTNKIFQPMAELINILKNNGFEVWIVTASPEFLYQKFLSVTFSIPITNIIGVKSVIRNGIITDEIVRPVPQDKGKKEAIETFIQGVPLLVAGNSRGDKEMIEHSAGIKMIVNPDEHIAHDQKESIATYADRHNWIIIRINDVVEIGFPAVSSKKFGTRKNKVRFYRDN